MIPKYSNNDLLQNTGPAAPLFYTLFECLTVVMKSLLYNHADPKVQHSDYGTPLRISIDSGDEITTQMLLDHGAEVNIPDDRHSTTLSI